VDAAPSAKAHFAGRSAFRHAPAGAAACATAEAAAAIRWRADPARASADAAATVSWRADPARASADAAATAGRLRRGSRAGDRYPHATASSSLAASRPAT
jgi:hypothetical protein